MKAKILRVTDNLILDMFGPGIYDCECTVNLLPADSKITAVDMPFEHPREIWFRIESETFPEIEPGMRLEFLESPVFKRFEDEIDKGVVEVIAKKILEWVKENTWELEFDFDDDSDGALIERLKKVIQQEK
jgi:hypothetical protein